MRVGVEGHYHGLNELFDALKRLAGIDGVTVKEWFLAEGSANECLLVRSNDIVLNST